MIYWLFRFKREVLMNPWRRLCCAIIVVTGGNSVRLGCFVYIMVRDHCTCSYFSPFSVIFLQTLLIGYFGMVDFQRPLDRKIDLKSQKSSKLIRSSMLNITWHCIARVSMFLAFERPLQIRFCIFLWNFFDSFNRAYNDSFLCKYLSDHWIFTRLKLSIFHCPFLVLHSFKFEICYMYIPAVFWTWLNAVRKLQF